MEGEEVFGSTNKEIGSFSWSEGDTHRPNKVNFSHPHVQTRFATTRLALGTIAEEFNYVMPHIQIVLETYCHTLE